VALLRGTPTPQYFTGELSAGFVNQRRVCFKPSGVFSQHLLTVPIYANFKRVPPTELPRTPANVHIKDIFFAMYHPGVTA
jgi:hypothetical protein